MTVTRSGSRRRSLIEKQIGPDSDDLRPSDLLIERFLGWKRVTKQLMTYLEGVADIERNTAKELVKLGGLIQVPFRESEGFLGEGGLQDILTTVRDKTRSMADLHSALATTVETGLVQHLFKLRTEIKAHVKNIKLSTGVLADAVAKERESSTVMIAELAKSITLLKNTPLALQASQDPALLNIAVERQLVKQIHAENNLQKSIIIMQEASATFETGIVDSLQSTWATFSHWKARTLEDVQKASQDVAVTFASLDTSAEWIDFAARSHCLLDPETPMRNPERIKFPGKEDTALRPVLTGFLKRKGLRRQYHEHFYILTPAGYLHAFDSSDPAAMTQQSPSFSLFLPDCSLGPPSTPSSKIHKFAITRPRLRDAQNKASSSGTVSAVGVVKSLFDREHRHDTILRAKSHEEMMQWWNEIKQLSKVYLVRSEMMDRTGAVPAAVRAIGYRDHDFDQDEQGEECDDTHDSGGSDSSGSDEYEEAQEVPRSPRLAAIVAASPAPGRPDVHVKGEEGRAERTPPHQRRPPPPRQSILVTSHPSSPTRSTDVQRRVSLLLEPIQTERRSGVADG